MKCATIVRHEAVLLFVSFSCADIQPIGIGRHVVVQTEAAAKIGWVGHADGIADLREGGIGFSKERGSAFHAERGQVLYDRGTGNGEELPAKGALGNADVVGDVIQRERAGEIVPQETIHHADKMLARLSGWLR